MAVTGPHARFPHLFQPLRIKGAVLPNRIAISGHFAGWWVDGGLPSDAFTAYLEERAKGGVGLFVIGATSPKPGSGWMENVSDDIIPHYRRLAEAGRRHGTQVFAQLCHPGFKPLPGPPIVGSAPSAERIQPDYKAPDRHVPSSQASGSDPGVCGRGEAGGGGRRRRGGAARARELPPRADAQSALEHPHRPVRRIAAVPDALPARDAVRHAKGHRTAPAARSAPQDGRHPAARDRLGRVPPGHQAAGSRGPGGLRQPFGRRRALPPRADAAARREWLPQARQARASTMLVVMYTGRIATPGMAEIALRERAADVICMTKTHIADPHFTRKVFENRDADIRFCTRCLQSCHGKMHGMTCVYNPLTSREAEWSELPRATTRKRIVIVGAGPAGMEAAITAAQRGHEVTVLEKSGEMAAGRFGRRPLRRCVRRSVGSPLLHPAGGESRVHGAVDTEATMETILDLRPDAVVIATGSTPRRLEIPGAPLDARNSLPSTKSSPAARTTRSGPSFWTARGSHARSSPRTISPRAAWPSNSSHRC